MGRVPSEDEVAERLDAGWTVEDIAAMADCSARSVRNIANAAGLELPQARRRAQRLAALDDAEALRTRLNAGESPSVIAARLSVGLAEVRAALHRHGLASSTAPRRTHRQLYEPGWLAGRLRARSSLRKIADEAGCSEGAVRTAIRVLGISDRRRFAERRFPQLHDEQWLRHRYLDETRTSTAIAAEVGCRPGSVLRALHRAGIAVRSGPAARRYPQLYDAALLRRRIADEGASIADLMAEIGCSRNAIRRALRRAGINSQRTSARYPRLRSRSWLRRAYVTDQLTIGQIAEQLGCHQQTVRAALRRADIALLPEPTRTGRPQQRRPHPHRGPAHRPPRRAAPATECTEPGYTPHMPRNVDHIVVEPRPDGRWARQRNGTKRAASLHDTQAEAEAAARAQAKRWHAELVVKGTDGRILRRDSYGGDPPRRPG